MGRQQRFVFSYESGEGGCSQQWFVFSNKSGGMDVNSRLYSIMKVEGALVNSGLKSVSKVGWG